MNKHIEFINKLLELGFYVYRIYEATKNLSCHAPNGVYRMILFHEYLSPITYEVPVGQITEKEINSIPTGEPKTQAE